MGAKWPNGSVSFLLGTCEAESGYFFSLIVISLSMGNTSTAADDQLLLTTISAS